MIRSDPYPAVSGFTFYLSSGLYPEPGATDCFFRRCTEILGLTQCSGVPCCRQFINHPPSDIKSGLRFITWESKEVSFSRLEAWKTEGTEPDIKKTAMNNEYNAPQGFSISVAYHSNAKQCGKPLICNQRFPEKSISASECLWSISTRPLTVEFPPLLIIRL
jgi:hypothetical protein